MGKSLVQSAAIKHLRHPVLQLEASAAAVARLRAVLHQLHGAKGRYVAGAIEAERAVRAGWAQALERAEVLDGDREDLKGLAKRAEAEAAELRVEARDAARGREEAERAHAGACGDRAAA